VRVLTHDTTGSFCGELFRAVRSEPVEALKFLWRTVFVVTCFVVRGTTSGFLSRTKLLVRLIRIHLKVPGGVSLPETLFLIETIDSAPTSGILLEIGSWKGLSTSCLSLVAESRRQRLIAVDTFSGLPRTEGPCPVASCPKRSYLFEQGAYVASLDEFWSNVNRYGCGAVVTTLQGDVCNMGTLGLPRGMRIAYAFLDVDLPTSYEGALRLMAPHIGGGTRIHLHEGLLEPILSLAQNSGFWATLGLPPPKVEILQATKRLRTLLVELTFCF